MRRALPLAALTRAAVRHYQRTFILAGIVLLTCLVLIPQVKIRASNLDLIDDRLPEVARFLQFAEDFGNPNPLIVVLWGDNPTVLGKAVAELAPEIEALEGVSSVAARLPIEDEILARAGTSPYFSDDLETHFYVFVQLTDHRADVTVTGPVVTRIEALLAERLQAPVQAGLTGIPKYALDDQNVIKNDIQTWSLVSIGVIALIFMLGFHRLHRPLLAVLTLPFGVLPTLALVVFYPGHLTLLSALFASILFGLGIDFGIHITAAFERALGEGQSGPDAAVAVVTRLESSLSTSALTTAGAFALLGLSGFKGFQELGLLAAVGTLCCLLSSVTLLPALLARFPGKPPDPTRALAPVRHAGPGRLLLAATSLGACGWLVLGVPPYQDDYRALQPAHSTALALEDGMIKDSDYSPYFAAFAVPDRAASEALAETLRETPSVGSVHALTDLDYFYEQGEPMPAVPDSFARQFRDGRGRYAVFAYPAGNIWDPVEKRAFLSEMRALDPLVTGMPFLSDFMMNHALAALRYTGLWVALFIFAVMVWDFRAPSPVLTALTVPLATVGLTLTLMRLLGIPFNPLNVMAFPIILGISVDDGVHLLHRYLDADGDQGKASAQARRAVLLTSLTTMAAFGCIILSEHRGLRSFCLTVVLGVASALIASLVYVPLLGSRLGPTQQGRTA